MTIKKAAVIGAGVMGSGIAAHFANAGIPVVLLDIVPQGAPAHNAEDRNAIAKSALDRLAKAEPAAFMHPKNARLVTPGNIEDDLGLLADCDWILEAVIEHPGIKRTLYQKLETVRRPSSIVSSNTSTIPLRELTEGLPARFTEDFLITHFFNPPRYMRLLEIVAGPRTRPEAAKTITEFCDVKLGKGVVTAKDTPGFIANRIGHLWIETAIHSAIALGLTVEEADAVMGPPFGIPKTGVFGLLDLVGIDLVPHVAQSMRANLPKSDPIQLLPPALPLVERMIAEGLTGRKGKGGFYRVTRQGSERIRETIDLVTGQYRPTEEPRLASLAEAAKDPAALLAHPDRGGQFARRVFGQVLGYAAALVPEIADTITAVDEAMRLGYNWKFGPFELIDRIGTDRVAASMLALGQKLPPLLEQARGRSFYDESTGTLGYLTVGGTYAEVKHAPGILLLSEVKRRSKPLARSGVASLWDIGDGVTCLEFHSKMNTLEPDSLALLQQAIGITAARYKAMVIYNEGEHFSAGANLGVLLFAANIAAWPQIAEMVGGGQAIYKTMKYARFPVVGAPSGLALGGGCEILLHCDAIQAHAESYVGLVETGVGLVPGWGGCKEFLIRQALYEKRPRGPMPPVAKAFETIALAKVSKSAAEAKEFLYLRETDGITMNRDRLLADAKAKALDLAKDYHPPQPQEISLPGATARAGLGLAVNDLQRQGKATPYDGVVAGALAEVLSGGDTDITQTLSEDKLLGLERASFMKLVRRPETLARLEHMLETGKPLRN
jgi:3-hydroxyacyl-CoA dehydrogenase